MSITLETLARRIDARLVGDGSIEITGCATIQTAGPNDVTFLANPSYLKYLSDTRAAAVMIDPTTDCPDHVNRLIVDDPYFAFRNVLVELYGYRRHPEPVGATSEAGGTMISPLASVHPEAVVADGVKIHAHATVEQHARIGAGTILYPGVFVGTGAAVGEHCVLYPNAVIYDRCIVGDRVTIHANTVIGQDGFGYATHDGRHHKIPQTGVVVIEDDVELGAGCAVERAALGETRIGAGTKFADLISIGHGTTIGRHCLLVSLVGVSGSVEIGNYVVLGGQVGVTGHLTIGDGVQAAGKAAIVHDVPPGRKVAGVPAIDLQKAKRNALAAAELYELFKRVRRLEKRASGDP